MRSGELSSSMGNLFAYFEDLNLKFSVNFSLFFFPLARGVVPVEVNEKVSTEDLQVLWIKFRMLHAKQTEEITTMLSVTNIVSSL